MTETDVVRLGFEGPGPYENRLTWAQIWWQHHSGLFDPKDLPNTTLTLKIPLPDKAVLGDVLKAIRLTVERNESLRTKYPVGPDGTRRQAACERGTVSVVLHRLDSGADTNAVADNLRSSLTNQIIDLSEEWPVRFAVVLADDRPDYLIVAADHIAIDGIGKINLIRQLNSLMGDGGSLRDDRTPIWQPRHQVVKEAGAEARHSSEQAVSHWEGVLGRLPTGLFAPALPSPTYPRIQMVRLESRALELAAVVVAGKYRTTVSNALLAAAETILGIHLGVSQPFYEISVANRRERSEREAIGAFVQSMPVSVSLAGADFGDIVRSTGRAAMLAYRHSHYDPASLSPVLDRFNHAFGTTVDFTYRFNDARIPRSERLIEVTAQDIEKARSRTTLAGAADTDWSSGPRALFMLTGLPSDDRITLSLFFDTQYFTPDQAQHMLRGMESLLICGSRRELAPADIAKIVMNAEAAG
ncbi:condensation domain-containing protein [Streptomyces sp. NPDC019531]|uniref:condensation domain-containing protein n=1 Tax=Streptomyces sp. NPDC019531 TaxID=3365062 RepID=UPI00384E40BD